MNVFYRRSTLVIVLTLVLANVGRAAANNSAFQGFDALNKLWARQQDCDDALKDRRFRDAVTLCERVVEDNVGAIEADKTWLGKHDRRAFHETWVMNHRDLVSAELNAARYSLGVAVGLLAINYRTEGRRRVAFARDLLKQVHQEDLRTDDARAYYAKIRSNMAQIEIALQ